MVDNVPFVLELITDVLVTITAKLLLENGFNVLQDHSVVDQFSILGDGHLTGFTPTNAISSLVVKTTAWNT
jgi:hypothetical protein